MAEPRDNRVPFMMSDRELKEIDEWRFDNRVATRADALRRLCKLGLAVDQMLPRLQDALDETKVAVHKAQQSLPKEASHSAGSTNAVSASLALASLKLSKAVNAMTTKAAILKSNDSPEELLAELDRRSDDVAHAFAVLEAHFQKADSAK